MVLQEHKALRAVAEALYMVAVAAAARARQGLILSITTEVAKAVTDYKVTSRAS